MGLAGSNYKGVDSYVIQSPSLRAEFVAWGAKLVSLKGVSGRETLEQNPAKAFIVPHYAMDFSMGEIAGADEMFPTISACRYKGGAWDGVLLPDHGEVWSLKWEASIDGGALVFSVDGIVLPYRLTKRVWIEGCTLKSAYQVINKSPFPLHALWAYHPLFVIEPDGRIEVGANTGRAMLTCSMNERAGRFGDDFTWPIIKYKEGDFLADRGSAQQDRYEKYYFKDKLVDGRCALYTVRDCIEMLFDVRKTGYLGIWNNQGGYLGGNQIAPQPCSAPYDRPDLAHLFGEGNALPPYGEWEWSLDISVSCALK